MRIDRLELETASNRVDLRLHPRITFVTGLGASERNALGTEILESLRQGRPGLSVDVVQDDGRIIEVYRPLEGAASVRDAVTTEDLTDQYLHFGTINLLAVPPLPEASQDLDSPDLLRVRRRGLMRSGELSEADDSSGSCAEQQAYVREVVTTLALLNQDVLWATATVLAETEVEIASITNSAQNTDDTSIDQDHLPSALAALVEERHSAVEFAADRLESDRVLHLSVAVTLCLIAMIGAILISPFLAAPFLLAAIGAGSISAWRWRELSLASQAELEALEAAGLTSYLNLRVGEVERLTKGVDAQRQQLDKIHELALDAWRNLVGPDVSLAWAVTHQEDICAAATTLRNGDTVSPQARECDTEVLGSFLPWLHHHLARVAAEYKQCVPVVLDGCFSSATSGSGATAGQPGSTDEIELIVELLMLHSQQLQLIVMTENSELLRRFPTSADSADILRLGTGAKTDSNQLLDLRS